jgi:hypothetical protein
MNFRSSGLAACLLAAVTAGCGTVTASSSGGGAHPATTAMSATASAVHATASGAATASATKQSQAPSAGNASTGARSGCQHLANDSTLTLASNGGTYCIGVGEHFNVYLRGTLASRWLVPLASSNVIVGVPNGALSLIAGLTGASFAAARPGQVFITSVRPPCAGSIAQKNELEPAFPLPKTYPLHACSPQRRFIVTVIVLS